MIFSPDGKLVASGGRGLRLWNLETGEEVESFDIDVYSLAFSPDGSCIAAGCGSLPVTPHGNIGRKCNYNIRVINLELAKIPYFYDDGFKSVPWLGLGWGLKLLRGEVWPSPFEGHQSTVYAVAYSADGKKIASSAGGKTVQVWDVSTGLGTAFTENFSCRSAAFSGTTLLNLSVDASPYHDRYVIFAFSADGRFLAIEDIEASSYFIWDTTHRAFLYFIGYISDVVSVAFFPDGKQVMSASTDGTILVWDLELREERGEMDGWRVNTSWFHKLGYWILGPMKENLFWAPLPLRHTRNTLVKGKCLEIDFSNFVHGYEWVKCREPL